MIDFSGFKDFERTSRDSFIQLWEDAHRIKGAIEVAFYNPVNGEEISVVNDNGSSKVYGLPEFDTVSGQYNFRVLLKVRMGESFYPFAFDFGIRADMMAFEKYGIAEINALHFFRVVAESFPGAVLEDDRGDS